MKDKLTNKKVIIIFSIVAISFCYWLFLFTIEIKIDATINKQKITVVKNEKFPEKFYKKIDRVNIYKNDTLIETVKAKYVKESNNSYIMKLEDTVLENSYDEITVDTKVYYIF